MRVLRRMRSHKSKNFTLLSEAGKGFYNLIADESRQGDSPMIGRQFYVLMLLSLQQLYRVAQLRGALVKLLCNRGLHLALHDLQFGKRALCPHFVEPFVEKRDLGALRYQFRKV